MKHLIRRPHIILNTENGLHAAPQSRRISHGVAMRALQMLGGGKVVPISGRYGGQDEGSILISDPSEKQAQLARQLAQTTGQESHIESDGYSHKMYFDNGPDAGKIVHGKGTVFHDHPPADMYSVMPDKTTFSHNFDFDAPQADMGKSEINALAKTDEPMDFSQAPDAEADINKPLTVRGNPVADNPAIKYNTKSTLDAEKGVLHTPKGSFNLYTPGHNDGDYQKLLNQPDIQGLHQNAMKSWMRLNQMHRSGQKIPDAMVAHANAFSILSANTPVPQQELAYSRLVDTMKDKNLDLRDPEFRRQMAPGGVGREGWLASDSPTELPRHSRPYWEHQARPAITQTAYSEGTGRGPGDITALGTIDAFSSRLAKYPQAHKYMADLVNSYGADSRAIATQMMADKSNPKLPKDHAMKVGMGLGSKTGRYAVSMMGGGNTVVPDTHFIRHMFNLDANTDANTLAYIKNTLWNPKNNHLLNTMDTYYHKNHPAVKFVQDKYFGGKEDENSIFPAFWLHWLTIAPHEKIQGIGKPHTAKNLTDHTPLWDTAKETLDKYGLGQGIKKSVENAPLHVRTAAATHELEQKLGAAPASMIYYAYMVPQLMAAKEEAVVKPRVNHLFKSPLTKSIKDRIPGGLADKKKPSDFDPRALRQGVKVEMEHTSDPEVASEIARDHLVEDKKYYDKLKVMESGKIKKGWSGDKMKSIKTPAERKADKERSEKAFKETSAAIIAEGKAKTSKPVSNKTKSDGKKLNKGDVIDLQTRQKISSRQIAGKQRRKMIARPDMKIHINYSPGIDHIEAGPEGAEPFTDKTFHPLPDSFLNSRNALTNSALNHIDRHIDYTESVMDRANPDTDQDIVGWHHNYINKIINRVENSQKHIENKTGEIKKARFESGLPIAAKQTIRGQRRYGKPGTPDPVNQPFQPASGGSVQYPPRRGEKLAGISEVGARVREARARLNPQTRPIWEQAEAKAKPSHVEMAPEKINALAAQHAGEQAKGHIRGILRDRADAAGRHKLAAPKIPGAANVGETIEIPVGAKRKLVASENAGVSLRKSPPVIHDQPEGFSENQISEHAYSPRRHADLHTEELGNGLFYHRYKDNGGGTTHSISHGRPEEPVSVLSGKNYPKSKNPRAFTVTRTAAHPVHQGKGLGVKLKELALRHHGKIQSDAVISPAEHGSWEKFGRKNIGVKLAPPQRFGDGNESEDDKLVATTQRHSAQNKVGKSEDMSQKGVHEDLGVFDIGTSNVGVKVRAYQQGSGTSKEGKPGAMRWVKQQHKKKLKELKEMPKPNLPKSEAMAKMSRPRLSFPKMGIDTETHNVKTVTTPRQKNILVREVMNEARPGLAGNIAGSPEVKRMKNTLSPKKFGGANIVGKPEFKHKTRSGGKKQTTFVFAGKKYTSPQHQAEPIAAGRKLDSYIAHEAAHRVMNRVEQLHGGEAKNKLLSHLMEHSIPDVEDRNALFSYTKKRGYSPSSDSFNEEMLNTMRDVLTEPRTRRLFGEHYASTAGATEGTGRDPQLYLNRLKQSWQKLYDRSQNITHEDVLGLVGKKGQK
jgi:Protein of unknown function (DUF5661)